MASGLLQGLGLAVQRLAEPVRGLVEWVVSGFLQLELVGPVGSVGPAEVSGQSGIVVAGK